MSFFKIKPIWKGNSKHKKLSEEAARKKGKATIIDPEIDPAEAENDVVTFKLKYLGSHVIEKTSADKSNLSADAVKTIIKTAKANRKQQKKLQRVLVIISTQGIAVTDLDGNDIYKISIYRISNCASDSVHRQVFSFIATDAQDTMECHAFYCSKRKLADTVTLTVSRIFTHAYETWRDTPQAQQLLKNQLTMGGDSVHVAEEVKEEKEEKLIDFDSEEIDDDDWEFDELMTNRTAGNNSQWVSFEDDFMPKVPKMPPQNNLILV